MNSLSNTRVGKRLARQFQLNVLIVVGREEKGVVLALQHKIVLCCQALNRHSMTYRDSRWAFRSNSALAGRVFSCDAPGS